MKQLSCSLTTLLAINCSIFLLPVAFYNISLLLLIMSVSNQGKKRLRTSEQFRSNIWLMVALKEQRMFWPLPVGNYLRTLSLSIHDILLWSFQMHAAVFSSPLFESCGNVQARCAKLLWQMSYLLRNYSWDLNQSWVGWNHGYIGNLKVQLDIFKG